MSVARSRAASWVPTAYLAEGIPTLLVWGGRDAIIPVGHARLAHAAIPGSRLEVFEDAGHFPHHRDPARFVAVVSDFVEHTQPAPFDPAFWRDRLLALNQAEAQFEALEWRIIHSAMDTVQRYVDSVVIPAIERAEKGGRPAEM